MADEKSEQLNMDAVLCEVSRRGFVASSLTAGLDVSTRSAFGAKMEVAEKDVEIKTPDGLCDAVFTHPVKGAHPGVLIWPDSLGLRPTMRALARRIAAEGYAALVPNHLYRSAKAPVFDASFDYANNPADREKAHRVVQSFVAPGAAERDAVAYVSFLDAQPQVDKKRKLGVHGYCLGGAYVLKTAALLPDRVGAGASFHGGFLVTAKPESPHLLIPKIKARLYLAIAADDDAREPEVKEKLKAAFAVAGVRAEVELYPGARHGWCVPDNKPAADNTVDAERAWSKLLALYKDAL